MNTSTTSAPNGSRLPRGSLTATFVISSIATGLALWCLNKVFSRTSIPLTAPLIFAVLCFIQGAIPVWKRWDARYMFIGYLSGLLTTIFLVDLIDKNIWGWCLLAAFLCPVGGIAAVSDIPGITNQKIG